MTVVVNHVATPLEGYVGEVLRILGAAVLDVQQCLPRRLTARIDPKQTVEVARKLIAMEGSRLATATGIEVRDGIDVLYHWCLEPRDGQSPPPAVVLTIKVLARRPELAVDSIAGVVPAANWIEREIHDLLGANFNAHPDMRRLLLDDSWPEDVHPLQKEFDQILDRPPLPSGATAPGSQTKPQEGSA